MRKIIYKISQFYNYKKWFKVFELKKRVNCWANVNLNIDIHLKSIIKVKADKIIQDIDKIEKIYNSELFATAIKIIYRQMGIFE